MASTVAASAPVAALLPLPASGVSLPAQLELGLLNAPPAVAAHSSKRGSRSKSPAALLPPGKTPGEHTHSSRSRRGSASASASVSRVRVHADTPELSIVLSGGGGSADEHKGAMSVETPAGGNEDMYMDDDVCLKDGMDRSRRSTRLLRELDGFMVPDSVLNEKRLSKKVREHYEAQNELVDAFKTVVRLEESESAAEREQKEEAEANQNGAVKFAIEASLALTFVLIVLKFSAAIWSGSMAVIASAVDSALDVLSQGTLVLTSRFMHRKDPVAYPIGKSRVENLSVLVFGVIMGLAAVFLLYQSILVLVDGMSSIPEIRIDAVTLSILGFTIVIQAAMYVFCTMVTRRGGRNVSAVEAVAQDHANDVCCNMIGLGAAVAAAYEESVWFCDAVGGILISIYIFARWVSVCHEQFSLLLGRSAEGSFLNQLTYLSTIHDPRILKVDTVLAYRLGAKLHCEVHIVLPADMPLKVAHDIGESLEQNIEKMKDVELAFVHLDFEWSHRAEHDRWAL